MAVLGVFISGRGSNLEAIIGAIKQGKLTASIGIVISDRPDVVGVQVAQRHHIPTKVVQPTAFSTKREYEESLIEQCRSYRVQWIVLAGYMRILGDTMINHYCGHILNIHPSLLPHFKGLNPQQQALDAGVSESGCTVHYVEKDVDSGPIILQKKVPIYPTDTVAQLSQRILEQEHILYAQAIQSVINEEKGVRQCVH